MKKKTKTDYLYLKKAVIMKLFLNKTFLTEGHVVWDYHHHQHHHHHHHRWEVIRWAPLTGAQRRRTVQYDVNKKTEHVIKHVISMVRRGSRDDKQWIRLRTLLNRASINFSILKIKSVIRHLRPFLNIELILERLYSERNPEKTGRAYTIRDTINAWNKILKTFMLSLHSSTGLVSKTLSDNW